MNIRESKIYEYVKNNEKDSVIAIPFNIKSGITITESNIKYVFDIELIDYNKKIMTLKEIGIDYPEDKNIEEKLMNQLESRIGLDKKELKFIYVNRDTIDLAISQIEDSSEFIEWCIE